MLTISKMMLKAFFLLPSSRHTTPMQNLVLPASFALFAAAMTYLINLVNGVRVQRSSDEYEGGEEVQVCG